MTTTVTDGRKKRRARKRADGFEVEPLPEGEARYERLARAKKEHSLVVFEYDNRDRALMVDVLTAGLLVQVADALNASNREKFLKMDLGVMVNTAWKLVSR